ncbi:peptidyl-prolyl cis-trans isomerase [Pseudonocardia sp. RS11V-5]|uniref:peptidyl-prolyl cis-trans isomerase n=1 Tax=Pseudonocardia terrae TaxID=2905831 RepID=UPI001E39C363|nr:peptidyl-prolyl cis-trans isomerase [Pseudonocardia terrae]MCE3552859.1 peptidyl-prolyl cis-trans isomerase [Pseudonocardia terrae]
MKVDEDRHDTGAEEVGATAPGADSPDTPDTPAEGAAGDATEVGADAQAGEQAVATDAESGEPAAESGEPAAESGETDSEAAGSAESAESAGSDAAETAEPAERSRSAAGRILHRSVHAVRHPRVPRTWPGRIVAGVVVLALLAGVGGFVWYRATALPEGAALAVGDRVVTVAELDDRVQTLHALYGVQAPTGDPAKLDAFRRDAAKAVAVSLVLDGQAQQLGVGVADTKVRETLNGYITQQLGPGPTAHDDFVKVLGNVGTTEDKVLDEIRQQMAVGALFTKVTEDVTTTDEDVQAAFPRYADRLGVPETRALRNIVVTNQDAANRIADKLRGGADFAELARSSSIDTSTRDKGGDLGTVSADQLQSDYGKAAFGTPAGQVFGPLQNQFGWNVGQVVSVTPGTPAQFDQVKDKLRQLVDFDRRVDAWGAWMRQALEDGDVRYAEDYTPADPLAIPTGAQPGAAPAPGSAQPDTAVPAAPLAPGGGG